MLQLLNTTQGPSMIKYAQKVVLKNLNLKNNQFSTFTFKKTLKPI
jgi:hypothetical protein